MKKLRSEKTPNPNARLIRAIFRVNSGEMATILQLSHAYASGNISEWMRYAALHFRPAKKDLKK